MMEIRFAFLATRLDFINNKKVFFEKPFQGLEKNTFLFFARFVESGGNILWNRDNRLTKYFSALRYNRINHFQEVI